MKKKINYQCLLVYCTIFYFFFCSTDYAQCKRLVWSEEFNGTQVNRDIWDFRFGTTYDGLHYFTDRSENAEVSNGTLKIIAREESYMGSDYTSAYMFTNKNVGWRYGRIEASIKLPSTHIPIVPPLAPQKWAPWRLFPRPS